MNKRVLKDILWVALGGAVGASLRYVSNQLVPILLGNHNLVTATAIENILGSFLIGVLFTLFITKYPDNRKLILFCLTGIIGSYTTYSGFMVEAMILFNDSLILFPLYLLGQIISGLIFVGVGMIVANKCLN